MGECLHRDRRGDGDVEALDEAVHRDAERPIGHRSHLGRCSPVLVSKHDRHAGFSSQLVERPIAIHRCHEQGVAFFLESSGTALRVVVPNDVEPSLSAFRDSAGCTKAVVADDDVDVLNTKRICASEDGARVVGVGDRIEHQHHVIGSAVYDVREAFQSGFGDDRRERVDDQLRRMHQRRRPFDFGHVWVVRAHLWGGLLRVDRHAHDERAALVCLSGNEEGITGGGHDLE